MTYLKSILKRNQQKLVRRVYMAQKDYPTIGDYCKFVEDDFIQVGEEYRLELDRSVVLEAEKKIFNVVEKLIWFILSGKDIKQKSYSLIESSF